MSGSLLSFNSSPPTRFAQADTLPHVDSSGVPLSSPEVSADIDEACMGFCVDRPTACGLRLDLSEAPSKFAVLGVAVFGANGLFGERIVVKAATE